jgi:hypothetical protein
MVMILFAFSYFASFSVEADAVFDNVFIAFFIPSRRRKFCLLPVSGRLRRFAGAV